MRIKLTVSYDGTNYSGWQVQPNSVTIQEKLEEAVKAVTGETVRVTGSGRTDAGVHAVGQIAHFDTKSSVPPEKFYKALNVYLPEDIKVVKSECVNDDFNACISAKKKTYAYSFYFSDVDLPLKERFAVRIDREPNVELMKSATKILVGKHDFKAFCSSGSGAKTTVRTIYSIKIKPSIDGIGIFVCGNGFLYNMVRIIVGTLLKVGYGEMNIDGVKEMLLTGNRAIGGKTLPAKGLRLEKVEY